MENIRAHLIGRRTIYCFLIGIFQVVGPLPIKVGGGKPDGIVVDGHINAFPSYSRNGRWIYFVSDRTGEYQIWKVDQRGNSPVQVTAHGGWFPTESFNGRFLYYVKSPFPASTGSASYGEWRPQLARKFPFLADLFIL